MFSVAHELEYWGHRNIAPGNAMKRLLLLLHETDQSASAMKTIARSRFLWLRLDKELERTSAPCDTCVQVLSMPA